MTSQAKIRSIRLTNKHVESLEAVSSACNNVPKDHTILRVALDLGFKHLLSLSKDDIAKEIRGF
jgi:hypothetical protein